VSIQLNSVTNASLGLKSILAEPSPLYKNELGFFELYTLNSGDSWVSLANTFYADPRLWWVIPLFNDIEDPFGDSVGTAPKANVDTNPFEDDLFG
jgi:hypothetical protein